MTPNSNRWIARVTAGNWVALSRKGLRQPIVRVVSEVDLSTIQIVFRYEAAKTFVVGQQVVPNCAEQRVYVQFSRIDGRQIGESSAGLRIARIATAEEIQSAIESGNDKLY